METSQLRAEQPFSPEPIRVNALGSGPPVRRRGGLGGAGLCDTGGPAWEFQTGSGMEVPMKPTRPIHVWTDRCVYMYTCR